MATLGEFGSLLQLGVGIGIGLSVFQAPTNFLRSKLEENLSAELDVFEKISTPRGLQAKADLSDLKTKLSNAGRHLDKLNMPFMIAAILGAVVNWIALIFSSLDASRVLTGLEQSLLLGASVAWYLLIGVSVVAAAVYYLSPLSRELDEIRLRS